MVPVEAGVHAAELGQAHRHVAVVEDDRQAVALAQVGGDASQVGHRHREDDERIGPLALDERVEMLRQRGVTQRQITSRVIRSPSPSSGLSSARRRYESPLSRATTSRARANDSPSTIRRVRGRPPPRRFDRPPAIRGDDEIDALLVEALPELPPRGRAAVAEVEIDGGGGNEQLHAWKCLTAALRSR